MALVSELQSDQYNRCKLQFCIISWRSGLLSCRLDGPILTKVALLPRKGDVLESTRQNESIGCLGELQKAIAEEIMTMVSRRVDLFEWARWREDFTVRRFSTAHYLLP